MRRGKTLFRALTQHTLSEVQKTGLPYFHYPERLQRGNTFGERFSNAIAALFQKGYSSVITIGNDCPQLQKNHLLQAASALEQGQAIILPSADGGFNLLGLSKSHFLHQEFKGLPWQTSQLFAQTLHYFKKLECVPQVMGTLRDVDSLADAVLLFQVGKGLSKTLLTLLKSIALGQPPYWRYNESALSAIEGYFPPKRGSPTRA